MGVSVEIVSREFVIKINPKQLFVNIAYKMNKWK